MIRLPQALADLLHWAQVEAPLPLAVVGMAVLMILFMGAVTMAKAKQDQKQAREQGEPKAWWL